MISVKNISLAVLGILVVIQFFGIDKESPIVDKSKDFIQVTQPPLDVTKLIKKLIFGKT